MAVGLQVMEGITEHVFAAPIAAGTALFALIMAFSYIIFHQTTYKEEKGFINGQKVAELESVESSQERRSKKEREEEQALEDSDDEPAAKRPRLDEPTISEIVEKQLDEYNERVHLVTFAATDAEVDFIFKYVPRARYLISLDAEEHHDHITEVRYAPRMRSYSAPADIWACT